MSLFYCASIATVDTRGRHLRREARALQAARTRGRSAPASFVCQVALSRDPNAASDRRSKWRHRSRARSSGFGAGPRCEGVRSQRTKLDMKHERLAIVSGDVLDSASVEAAVHGQDAVLCALGHKRWFYPTRIWETLSADTRVVMAGLEPFTYSRCR
jgi:hypothetical protein